MNALYRWAGYLLLAWTVLGVGFGFQATRFYDPYALAIAVLGIAGALLVGFGRDIWRILRAWPLRDNAGVDEVEGLERLCGLAIAANWMMALFGLAAGAVMLVGFGGTREQITAGTAVGLLSLVYAPLIGLFFHAHRVRAQQWLSRHRRFG